MQAADHGATAVPGPSAQAVALDEGGHATRRFDSWRQAGWRSVLLRTLDNDDVVDEVQLPATNDQLLVLVTRGRASMEVLDGARWRRCDYAPGRLALTAPGRPTTLRWRTTSTQPHRTLHLYLPASALEDAAQQVWGRSVGAADLPDALGTKDPLVAAVMTTMADAAAAGADDVYAQSAVAFLAVHLLTRHLAAPTPTEFRGEDARVRRAIEFMHDNLALPLTLSDIAAAVELSPFHFARLFKASIGQPPRHCLSRFRAEAAGRHLDRSDLPVADIAYLCGFSSPSHLAAAFRRHTGLSPSGYRRVRRNARSKKSSVAQQADDGHGRG